MNNALFAILLIGVFFCCDQRRQTSKVDDLLARVGTKELHLSDIEGFVKDGMSPEDSLSVLNAYVDQWVRRKAVLEHAEKSMDGKINISQLIEDYRASLLLHNYRDAIIESELDTTITKEQVESYYASNKGQYQLPAPIMKAVLFKVKKGTRGIKKMERLWKKNKIDEVKEYIIQRGGFYLDDERKWYQLNEFFTYLPKRKLSEKSLKSNARFQFTDDGMNYYIKVLEYIKENEDPPLSYVEHKLRKVIINTRKRELLEELENKIYENALETNRVKVYTK